MNKLGFLVLLLLLAVFCLPKVTMGPRLQGYLIYLLFLIVFGGTLVRFWYRHQVSNCYMHYHYYRKYLPLLLIPKEQSEKIQKWSLKSRQHGLLSLEIENEKDLSDPFTEKGLAMLS